MGQFSVLSSQQVEFSFADGGAEGKEVEAPMGREVRVIEPLIQ
jgi:hypothetical protein